MFYFSALQPLDHGLGPAAAPGPPKVRAGLADVATSRRERAQVLSYTRVIIQRLLYSANTTYHVHSVADPAQY